MQQKPQPHAPAGEGPVTKPAAPEGDIEGYAVHTGEARSTADVEVRGGSSPLDDRGQSAPDDNENATAPSIPSSGNAPA